MFENRINDLSLKGNSPKVLGVYLGHDLGACLLCNGQIVVMIEEERLTRFKHGYPNYVAGIWDQFAGKFGYFPWASVSYCLETAGLGIDDLDLIVLSDNNWAEAAAETMQSIIPIKDRNKVIFMTGLEKPVHHYHHALSTFMASPFEEAAVLVVDGAGNIGQDGFEAETGYLFENRSGKYREVFQNCYDPQHFPWNGLGWMYELVTLLLGFSNSKTLMPDSGKTMGLAAYGQPYPEFQQSWVQYNGFDLNFSGFHHWLKESGYDFDSIFQKKGLAKQGKEISQYAKDLAFKVQAELETVMLHLAEELYQQTGSRNLCLAGGVALNSVTNGLIAAKGPFEQIFIQPAANDAGQAIGLAYHGHLLLTSPYHSHTNSSVNAYKEKQIEAKSDTNGSNNIQPIKHIYGGCQYSLDEIRQLLVKSELPFQELPSDAELTEDVANELAHFRIVGWFQGGSEYGPRALGHRSILANPSSIETKPKLNARVKFREMFRPFAPMVLRERVNDVFELNQESPYMLLVAPVRAGWQERVPAITHVDGTARIQTIDAEVVPLLHLLISSFEQKTGIPVVLNTSFNLQGMPIVESPLDALQCFLYTDMDSLYLERFKIERPDPSHLFPSLLPEWRMAAEQEMETSQQTITFTSNSSSKIIKINATAELIPFLAMLDGKCSIATAYQHFSSSVCEPKHHENGVADLVNIVQSLVRQGVMQLRVGNLTFGFPTKSRKFDMIPKPKPD